ncbi:MAG: Trm112 family protein [Acidimicrobiales bacterium]
MPVQRPSGPIHTYDSPVAEFSLTRAELSAEAFLVDGPAIVFVTQGSASLGGSPLEVGVPAFVPASSGPIPLTGSGLAWGAGVGAMWRPFVDPPLVVKERPMALDPKLLEILACPEDKGPLLYFADEAVLFNPRLKRTYRIDNDIPVMLIDEASTVDDAECDRLQAKAEADGVAPTFAA